jgi:hypothetical protein
MVESNVSDYAAYQKHAEIDPFVTNKVITMNGQKYEFVIAVRVRAAFDPGLK